MKGDLYSVFPNEVNLCLRMWLRLIVSFKRTVRLQYKALR